MHSFFRSFLVRQVLPRVTDTNASGYQRAKEFRELRITVAGYARDASFMMMGIGGAAFGLEGFLLPNSFIDGGISGISLLVSKDGRSV